MLASKAMEQVELSTLKMQQSQKMAKLLTNAADLKKGDVLYFNEDLSGKKKFAEVYSNTVSGEIDSVFETAIRVDGKTYDFAYDEELVEDFDLSYASAVYVRDNGKTDYVDYKAAEKLQAAGDVTVDLDRGGNVVYIGGDLADVKGNTKHLSLLQISKLIQALIRI